ncbi:serine O-acetyltransferase [Halomonas sp. FeN2]|uniref:serine O-acetyltransferase EpsC n=1 Tax=Halomonas sp. FeN2 TaxID=2832500 RepID=UPI000C36CF6B|nr:MULTISPECIES: serine O-acetyltransferase EpsC [unclassified Halomonas]MBF58815.1 serine acetyltransferase [Halomonas sp.]UBR47940.1 serine O-acetyltransferase [Halomonas sp. FeN2]|tara:strand:+ start:661 stop:1422 length:762 start_codon:yes stop_codon:yes gene_type:complete
MTETSDLGAHAFNDPAALWREIQVAALEASRSQPLLADFYRYALLDHSDFASALAVVIAETLSSTHISHASALAEIRAVFAENPLIVESALDDLRVLLQEDAAIPEPFTPLLYFSGYRALQCHRVSHVWWATAKKSMASYLQFRCSCTFSVDIHPAACVGKGIFIDHGAGIVIGETAVVEDGVTIFQGVTLGGTGKLDGDRHPKIRRNAFLGANAVVLGNIEIGEGARIGAGAIVTKRVAAGVTVVGLPASAR